MKRKILKGLAVFFISFTFSLTFVKVASAEENVDEPTMTTEEITEEPVTEEVVEETITEEVVEEQKSVRDMIKDFINEWLIVILATLGGAGGTSVALGIAKGLLKKITDKVEESANNNKESNKTLSDTQKVVANGLECLTEKIEEFENKYSDNFTETSEKIIKCIDEINYLKAENEKFKKLSALLVSSNSQLASNGYATKILELLDEGSVNNE